MNARIAKLLDDPEERRARHLRRCQELADLAMELAYAAQRAAMSELDIPVEHRMPGMAAPPDCRAAHPGILFTRLSHAVRQAMLLEARIAARAFDTAPPAPPEARVQRSETPDTQATTPASPPASSRHTAPQGPSLERLEDDLAGEHTRSIPEIFAGIREDIAQAAHLKPPARRPTAKPPDDIPCDGPRERPANTPYQVTLDRPPPKPRPSG